MIYNTWNMSIRKMFRLDRTTHRYFIEPISNTPHIKTSLLKRFMKFTNNLACSRKTAAKNLFNIVKDDFMSTTGRNLRKIMHYCGKKQISDIITKEISEKIYHPIPTNEIWRLDLVKELLEIRDYNYDLHGWKNEEITDCIQFLCTTQSWNFFHYM